MIEHWKQSSAKVTGLSHADDNIECQDATFYLLQNGVHCIALADGAGSKTHSKLGAEAVTQKICHLMTNNFYDYLYLLEEIGVDDKVVSANHAELKQTLIEAIVKELNAISVNENISINDLASTLMFYAFKDEYYIMGHIGDGVIAHMYNKRDANVLEVLSHPENGDQPNITFFITDTDAFNHLRIKGGNKGNINGVLLMSDGPESLLYSPKLGIHLSAEKVLFQTFHGVLEDKHQLFMEKFLKEQVSKHSSDDLSLNILYKEEIDHHGLSKEYKSYLFNKIKSKEQLVSVSQYATRILPYTHDMKIDFHSIKAVEDYL